VAFGPPGTTSETVRPVADRLRSSLLSEVGSPGDVLEQMIPQMTRTEAARPLLLRYARDSHRPTVANAMHEIMVTDLRPGLARITAPMTVLYVVPSTLPTQPDEFERSLRLSFANAPQARFVRIDSSGHYIQIDQPTRFIAEVDAFMAIR
jgi:pimeloyl-ACP methyl ester carboxylesterase